MAPVKRKRLARGDFATVAPDFGTEQEGARNFLIDTIIQVWPELIEGLRKNVLPDFRASALGRVETSNPEVFSRIRAFAENPPDDPGLGKQLRQWCVDFNIPLQETWMIDWAIRTLLWWHLTNGKPVVGRNLAGFGFGGYTVKIRDDEIRFTFSRHGWEVQTCTWAEFQDGIRSEFARELASYYQRMCKLAESRGLKKVQRTFSPANFRYFVDHKLKGMTSTRIAAKENCGEDTILKGVVTVARLVGWQGKGRGRTNRKAT